MEIEFNASQLPPMAPSGPISRRAAAAGSSDETSSARNLNDLKAKLNQLPLERPDQVSQAQSAVSNPHYPPDDLLDRIAVLLAFRFNH